MKEEESLSDKELKRIKEQVEKLDVDLDVSVERARLRRELNEAMEQEQIEVEARDKEMKGKGFIYRVTFWDHCTGGDDVQSDIYFTADPETLTIMDVEAWNLWQEIKTVSLGDYKVIPLE